MTLGHAPTEYRLRYTPDGQIHLNDPRLSQALTDAMSDGLILVRQEDDGHYGAYFFYDDADLRHGPGGCDITGGGKTAARAVRNCLGWLFGAQELVDGAVRTGVAFHATSHTDRILD
jgi:hypothetical protein